MFRTHELIWAARGQGVRGGFIVILGVGVGIACLEPTRWCSNDDAHSEQAEHPKVGQPTTRGNADWAVVIDTRPCEHLPRCGAARIRRSPALGCSMNSLTGVLRDATAVTEVDFAALEHRRSAATPPMKLFYFAEPPGLVALRHLAC